MRRPSFRPGFTLVESVFAIAFLAMASLAVVASFIFSTKLDARKEGRHQAAFLALDSMNQARLQVAEDYAVVVDTSTEKSNEGKSFQIEVRQSFVGGELGLAPEQLKEVTVVVTWEDSKGHQSYSLQERFTPN